jgi:hypothetical protein
MAAADQQSDGEEQDYESRPWLNMTPTTRVKGTVTEIFTPELGESNYGIIIEDPEVVMGDVFVNAHKPDDGLTREEVDENSTSPTDYRVADDSDPSVTVVSDTLVTDEESTVGGDVANEYERADAFDDDEVCLWISGLAGDKIIRALDFNGRPYARYGDNGPIYGLLQAPQSWFEDGADRSALAADGKAPRTVRPPMLRPDVDEVLIDVTADDGGNYRSYRGNVFRADEFADETGAIDTPTDELPTGQYGIEADSRLELRLADVEEAGRKVKAADWNFADLLQTGEGWADVPESATSNSFDTSMDVAAEDDTDVQADAVDEFVTDVVEQMQATEVAHGRAPDEIWDGGLDSLIERNSDSLPDDPDVDAIRRGIYSNVNWLDTESLE